MRTIAAVIVVLVICIAIWFFHKPTQHTSAPSQTSHKDLSAKDPDIAPGIVKKLGQVKDVAEISAKQSADALRQLICDLENADTDTKNAANEKVWQGMNSLVQSGEDVLPVATALADDENPKVSKEGIRLMSMIGTSGSLERLCYRINHGDLDARICALEQIAEFPTGNEVTQEARSQKVVPILIACLGDDNEKVRAIALQTLSQISGEPFDFEAQAPETERKKQVEAILAWWKSVIENEMQTK